MPHLDAYCYLGVNFVCAFRAVLDADTDRLFCKDAGVYVELEVASLTTEPVKCRTKCTSKCAGCCDKGLSSLRRAVGRTQLL